MKPSKVGLEPVMTHTSEPVILQRQGHRRTAIAPATTQRNGKAQHAR